MADNSGGGSAQGPSRRNGAAMPGATVDARGAGTAEGLVVDEGTVADDESPGIADAPAEGGAPREGDGLVVGQDDMGELVWLGVYAHFSEKFIRLSPDKQTTDARRALMR